jgi:omega-amidase
MQLKISLAQLNIHLGDISKNLSNGRDFIKHASDQGSKIIIFPELWISGFDYPNIEKIALNKNNVIDELKSISKQYQIVIAGSYITKNKGKYENELIVIDSDNEHSSYQKIHLFRLNNEHLHFSPGNNPLIIRILGVNIGLSICYDLRFPELFRFYMKHGAEIVINSSEWPLKRIKHWSTLLIARAIENQYYLVGCNAAGNSGDVLLGGRSAVIDPWGKRIAICSSYEQALISTTIDTDRINDARSKLPVLDDSRFDIYG